MADGRWWGWGEEAHAVELPPHALAFLRETIGAGDVRRSPVALDDVRLPPVALGDRARGRIAAVVGAEHVRDDREARVRHAAGRGYPDLVRLRSGALETAPDAIVWPGSHEEVVELLSTCAQERVAVVPFGGGTSVVGGVEALRGDCAAVIALDLGRMDALLALDERSLTASFEGGLRGPAADALLAARGLTLGHLPQSYEYVSLGGAVATRSAGQASTGFGRIDELLVGVRLAAPAGKLELPPRPPSAAGPQLRELVAGSEGVLGVITRVDLRVRPVAPWRYEGWACRSFEEGVEALRALEQHGCAPAVARLSDEEETRLSLALAGSGGLAARAGRLYLRVRGRAQGCLVIVGWSGEPAEVAQARAAANRILRAHGAVALGSPPGEAWARGRFRAPYLRDALLDHGVMAETLETAGQWSGLTALHDAVRDALRDALGARGAAPLVMCHVSHLYPTGASLYFTFLARQQQGSELEQWRAAKHAASDAIAAAGGTITHHHAIGVDHAPWMAGEVGETGLELLRAAKARLDPQGIMNPGKLLERGASAPAA